jgi:mono/diheme cytochrome c family protein
VSVLRLALALLLVASGAAVAQVPNLERGRALYENHCRVCHTAKVHHRTPRLPMNRDQLREIVILWATEENLRWRNEDIDDVVFYLNMTAYHF